VRILTQVQLLNLKLCGRLCVALTSGRAATAVAGDHTHFHPYCSCARWSEVVKFQAGGKEALGEGVAVDWNLLYAPQTQSSTPGSVGCSYGVRERWPHV